MGREVRARLRGVTPSIDLLLTGARKRLSGAESGASTREALLLLSRLLGFSEAQTLARGSSPVPDRIARSFDAMIERRLTGEPVAYLLGEREFYGRDFFVDSRVLVPRPETEHLVEMALAVDLPSEPWVLDLGTGSGCVAITLALEIPSARVVAVDISPGALAVTTSNVLRHEVESRVLPIACDLAHGLRLDRFDLVVSNPPYIAGAVADSLPVDVREHEPHLALFAGPDGTLVLNRLVRQMRSLRRGARVLFEIGRGQAPDVEARVSASELDLVEIQPDYAGIPRIVSLRR